MLSIRNLLFPEMALRATEQEWMDDHASDEEKLRRTLSQFYWLNLLFSRSRGLLKENIMEDMLSSPNGSYTLLDVGAGGGDIAAWFSRQCCQHGLRLHITCLDNDPRVAKYAREKFRGHPAIEVVEASLFDLPKQPGFDYVFANNFLHHVPSELVPAAIGRMAGLARRLFLVNDLVRSPWAYAGFALFGSVFLHRSFAVADGLRSIRKGFLPAELRGLADHSGCRKNIQVKTLHPAKIFLLGKSA